MYELELDQFEQAAGLFEPLNENVPVFSVIEGCNPGRIFVDRPRDPTCAFLWMKTGYFYLAGDAGNDRFARDLYHLLFGRLVPEDRARGENGFILYPARGWSSQVKRILKGRDPLPIYRRAFHFDPGCMQRISGWQQRLPAGYTLVPVDRELIARHPAELEALLLTGWESIGRYLEKGFGFATLQGDASHGDQIASLCLSMMVTHAAAEIEILTHEPHRRQGLAAATAAAFIEESQRRGLTPHWECFWDNTASSNLAEKIGFLICSDHPVFYWEEPA